MKLTSINFRGEDRTIVLLVALGLVLAHSAIIALVGISKPIVDPPSFRQTQTALSVYWIMRDGISLAYETPVLGYPWSIPMEFPIYQWIVALFGVVGIPIEIAGRLVSYSFFIACLWPIWMIFRSMKLKTEIFLITAILFLSSPLYLFIGRTVMIESLALFLAALWLALLIALLTMPKATYSNFIAAVVAGSLAGLTKITTLLPFYFLAGLFFLERACISWRDRQISDRWKVFALAIVACAIPIVITYAWVVYADCIKAAGNPFGQGLTSAALMTWNFGTIRQRLTSTFWEDIVGHRVLNDLFGYGAIFAILLAGTTRTRRGLRTPVGLTLTHQSHNMHRSRRLDHGMRVFGQGRERFYSVRSRNSVPAKDSEPPLQRHPFSPAGSNRHQSMIAQPINYNGRRIAIPEECKITQKTQIAPP